MWRPEEECPPDNWTATPLPEEPTSTTANTKLGTCTQQRYLCITCRMKAESDEVLIRIQTNGVTDYCQGIKYDDSTYTEISPVPENWGIDIELSWNKKVSMDDAKITEDFVKNTPLTTDLLCSPGKYTDTFYQLDSIYRSFGNTFSGFSDMPREIVGVALNGMMLAQALTKDGQDSFYPFEGTADDYDYCGT